MHPWDDVSVYAPHDHSDGILTLMVSPSGRKFILSRPIVTGTS